jgi:hypothetical protein
MSDTIYAEPHLAPEPTLGTGGDYLIWSNEHGGWWGPGGWGYVLDWHHAGRYTRVDALTICHKALRGSIDGIPNELPVLFVDVEVFHR